MISKISSIQKIALRYLTARLMDEVFPGTKPADMEPLDAFSAADNLREEMGFLYLDLVKKVPQWKDFERKFTFLATRSKTEDAFRKSALREYRRDLQTIAIKINERDFSRALSGLYGEAEILNHLGSSLDIERVAKALFVVGKGAFTEIALSEIYESASHYAERHKQDRKQEVIDFFEGLPLPRGAYGSIHRALREGDAEEVAEEMMESFNEENIDNPPRFAREILIRVEECKQEMSERLMSTLSDTIEDILSQMRENFGGDLEAKHEALFRRLGMDVLESVSEKAVREVVGEIFEEKMNPSYDTLKALAQANRNKEKREDDKKWRELARRSQEEKEPIHSPSTFFDGGDSIYDSEDLDGFLAYFKNKMTQDEREELVSESGGLASFIDQIKEDYDVRSETRLRKTLESALS